MSKRPIIPPLDVPLPSSIETCPSDNSPLSDNEDTAREESLIQCLLSQVDETSVSEIIAFQKKCLERLEKTNAMLENCQQISESRLTSSTRDIAIGRAKIVEIKTDLEYIIRKIGSMKKMLKEKFPEHFARSEEPFKIRDEE